MGSFGAGRVNTPRATSTRIADGDGDVVAAPPASPGAGQRDQRAKTSLGFGRARCSFAQFGEFSLRANGAKSLFHVGHGPRGAGERG